jgi:holo-[acyl-carrier protein] synthase
MIVGMGIDIVEIGRVRRAWERRPERFERRVLTPREVERCRAAPRPPEALALRFAAKEALMKAVGTGWSRGVRWVDIETVPEGPDLALRLHGRVAEIAAREGPIRPHLAVARTRSHAMALVVLERGQP